MSIYDRIPYTYLIGWSHLNKFYYGRRTAKGCHPSEFWKTYFTSSTYVKEFVEKNGDPDIIEIRKTFKNVKSCEQWEHRFLCKIDAAYNHNFLNEHNGGASFSTSNKVGVTDSMGNTFMVSTNDPRFLNGELIALSKGRKASKESNARKAIAKGKIAVRNTETQECFLIDKIQYESEKHNGMFVPVGTNRIVSDKERENTSKRKKGKIIVKDVLGNIFEVMITDSRYASGILVQHTKGTKMAQDRTGKMFRATKDDPRWETGEIVNPYKGKPNIKLRGVSKPKTKCPYCDKLVANNMFERYHNNNCKHKK
jgi:hypothetical protein